MEPAELIRPLVKAGRSIKASSAKPRSPRMQLAAAAARGPRTQLTSEKMKSEKMKKLRSDCGKKRVKKVMKIAWYEGARWYEVKNQWIKLDDDNVSMCCLCLLIVAIGTCLSTF